MTEGNGENSDRRLRRSFEECERQHDKAGKHIRDRDEWTAGKKLSSALRWIQTKKSKSKRELALLDTNVTLPTIEFAVEEVQAKKVSSSHCWMSHYR